jgi:aspartate carbamoyltransferase catalytic subunit
MQHLLDISSLGLSGIQAILARAQDFSERGASLPPVLANTVVAPLFFEPSTRTAMSFQMACYHLGGRLLSFHPERSALQKGESIEDTVSTIRAMGVRMMVVRHHQSGIVHELARVFPDVAWVNAGDGTHQHPTQALLDILTMQQAVGSLVGKKIAIVGDSRHSRVAGSLLAALPLMGVEQITLVAPALFLPESQSGVRVAHTLDVGLEQADVVVALRFQKERMEEALCAEVAGAAADFCITPAVLDRLAPQAVLLHPGPVNVGVELSQDMMQDRRSLITQQVRNGVWVRAAVFAQLCAALK